MKTPTTYIILIFCILSSIVCTQNTSGLTESTNQRVAGMLYEPDGTTPAKEAIVIIRPKNSLPFVAGFVSGQQNGSTDTVVTDDNGRFAFKNELSAGIYSIEAHKGGNAVFFSSVNVSDGEKTVTVAPDTLKPAGALTGTVFLAGGGDPTEVYVLAFGCDRFTRVHDDATFRIDGLGEGEYHLKIVTSIDNYTSFDTADIAVLSADTVDLGTIALPFSGVPVLQHVNVVWDTLESRAILSWDKIEYESVKYYNIYRWDIFESMLNDSITYLGSDEQVKQVNGYQVTDTLYVDNFKVNTAGGDGTPLRILYFVTVVDSSERESLFSPAGFVEPVQSFTISKETNVKVRAQGDVQDFCITRNGTILLTSSGHPCITLLDTAYNYEGRFPVIPPLSEADTATALSYISVAVCSDRQSDEYYFVRPDDFKIDIYRNEENIGIFIDSINDPTITAQGVTDGEVINGHLYILTGGDSLLCFDTDRERMYARYCGDLGTGKCLADGGAGRVVVGIGGTACKVCWYDSIGNRLSTSTYTVDSLISIAIDTTKQYCYILSGKDAGSLSSEAKLEVFGSDDEKIGRYLFTLNGYHFSLLRKGDDAVFLSGNGEPRVVLGDILYNLSWLNNVE